MKYNVHEYSFVELLGFNLGLKGDSIGHNKYEISLLKVSK